MVVNAVSLNHNKVYIEGISNTKLMGMCYQSGIAAKYNLSSSVLSVLYAICYHWNTIRQDSFPSQQLISSKTGLSIRSVQRSIKALQESGLVIKTTNKNGNLYKFTHKFFDELNFAPATRQIVTWLPDNLSHPCIEQKKYNKRNNKTSSIKKTHLKPNDDAFSIKTTNISDYKDILNKLDIWRYAGAKKIIKQNGIKKMQDLIKMVEKHNPENKGAYLRSLLTLPDINDRLVDNSLKTASEFVQVEQMLKHQYWKHIPSGKRLQVKPDIGTHLLIRYYKAENMVEFLEGGLVDKLENFEGMTV